jgi:DNA-binding response OmpR family regulator
MNTGMLSKPRNIRPVVTALLVSPFPSDHVAVQEVFSYLKWVLNTAYDCAEALAFLRQTSAPVVICECDLRDGSWKTVLQACVGMPKPPRLLVSSRVLEPELLDVMRDLGAYSVLTSPLDSREIEVRVQLAWHSWHREWRNTSNLSVGAAVSSPESGITVVRGSLSPARLTQAPDH